MSSSSRSVSVIALCLALTMTAVTACTTVPLVDPPRTPAGPTPEQSRAAIIRALADFRYVVDEESPGRIRARLQKNAWTMIVEVDYGKDIAVHYADSVGLDYEVEDDVPQIHQNYNVRAEQLVVEIRRQIDIVALESRGLPSVGGSTPPPPAAAPPATPPP